MKIYKHLLELKEIQELDFKVKFIPCHLNTPAIIFKQWSWNRVMGAKQDHL